MAFLIQSDNFFLLIDTFTLLIFKVIADVVEVTFTIFVTVSYMLPLFFLFLSFTIALPLWFKLSILYTSVSSPFQHISDIYYFFLLIISFFKFFKFYFIFKLYNIVLVLPNISYFSVCNIHLQLIQAHFQITQYCFMNIINTS